MVKGATMNGYILNNEQWSELASIYDACRYHNPSFYATRALKRVANQLVELGYADRMMSTTGKYKYRLTQKGVDAVLMRRGEK
jgi:hypothetical protein